MHRLISYLIPFFLTVLVIGVIMAVLLVLLALTQDNPAAILKTFFLGAVAGSFACTIPAALRLRFGASEMVTSLVLNYALFIRDVDVDGFFSLLTERLVML